MVVCNESQRIHIFVFNFDSYLSGRFRSNNQDYVCGTVSSMLSGLERLGPLDLTH